jgi:hypothetical protein
MGHTLTESNWFASPKGIDIGEEAGQRGILAQINENIAQNQT